MAKTTKNAPPLSIQEMSEIDRLVGSNPTDGSAPAISPVYLAESRRSRRGGESRPKDVENERRDTGEVLTPERARQQAAEAGEIDLRRALSTPGVNGVISPDARDRVKVSDVARYEIGSVFDDGREVVAIDRVEGVLTLAPVGTLAASVLSEHDLGTGRSAVGKAERFGVAAFLPTDAAPAGRLKARVRANMREYARANGWARYPDGADIRSDWGELGRGEYLLTQAEAEMADVESPEVMQADARAIAACRDYEAAAMHAAATEQSAQGALLRRCRVRLDRALAAAEWEARRRG